MSNLQIILSDNNVNENEYGAIFGTFTLSDGTTLDNSYTIVPSWDGLEVINHQLKLKDDIALDYEHYFSLLYNSDYNSIPGLDQPLPFSIDYDVYKDGQLISSMVPLSLAINNINEAPIDLYIQTAATSVTSPFEINVRFHYNDPEPTTNPFSNPNGAYSNFEFYHSEITIGEYAHKSTFVGYLTPKDDLVETRAPGPSHQYFIIEDESGVFSIDGAKLLQTQQINVQNEASYSLKILVIDGYGFASVQELTVNTRDITEINDVRAMWIWWPDTTEIVTDLTKRGEFFDFVSAPFNEQDDAINTIYIEADLNNTAYNFDQLANFISEAHQKGLKVEFLTGGAALAQTAAGKNETDAYTQTILNYNASRQHSAERFDGIHFDIEPHTLPDWEDQSENYLKNLVNLLHSSRQLIETNNSPLTLAADIPTHYADRSNYFKSTLNDNYIVDYLVIMNYYDTYHRYVGGNGEIGRVTGNLQAWEVPLIFGVETNKLSEPNEIDEILTFFEEGHISLEAMIDQVEANFGDNPLFAGFSVHDYSGYKALINTFNGTIDNDTITASDSDDRILGDNGNDRISDLAGNDTINAGSGNDYIRNGAGGDSIDGGDGTDTISYYNSDTGVNVNLTTGQGSGGYADNDTLNDVEYVFGTKFNDVLTGDFKRNYLIGNRGNDTLNGEAGNDRLEGNAGNDRINDGSGNDLIDAGDGHDYIRNGDGADTINGGDGTDTISYYNSDAGVDVNLTTGQGSGGYAQNDTIDNVEYLFGSKFDDLLTGDVSDNYLIGNKGNDTLIGGDGNDRLESNNGNDRIYAGQGDDFIFSGDGNDYIRVQAGQDTIDGGDGIDVISFHDYAQGVNAYMSRGTIAATFKSYSVDNVIFSNIERLYGTKYNDSLIGDNEQNLLRGGAGNDLIQGGLGKDILFGDAGDDRFHFTSYEDSNIHNRDEIRDFTQGDDLLSFDFTNLLPLSPDPKVTFDDIETEIRGNKTYVTIHDSDFRLQLDGAYNLTEDDFYFHELVTITIA